MATTTSIVTEEPAIELTSLTKDQPPPPSLEDGTPISPSDSQPIPPPPTQLLKLLSCAFSFFCAGANDGSLGSLLPSILTTYSIPPSLISLLYLTTFLGWLLCALISTSLPHHLSLGAILALGATFQLLSQCLRFWTPPFAVFSVSFFATGLGQAIQDSFANSYVSSVEGGVAHRWLGLVHAMYGLGLVISPFVATAIASHSPSHWTFFYIFPLGLSAVNLALVGMAFRDSVRKRDEGSKDGWKEMKQILRLKAVWILSLFFFFHLGVGTTSNGWIVEFLLSSHPSSHPNGYGYVPSASYAGLFVSRLLLAEPTHRLGERRMLLLYSFLCFAMQMVFWLVKNVVSEIVMFGMMGFVLGPFFAAGVSVASELFPRQVRAGALGFVFVVAQAGAAIFPSLIGLIATHAGVKVLPPIVAGLIVAMGVTWAFVPKIPNHHDD